MTKTAYCSGYTGKPTRKPEQLRQLAINLGAVVVDIRYNPRSRVAHWNKEALQLVLQNRYLWLQGFGNWMYKQGTIALHDPYTALWWLTDLSVNRAIILCACADGESCHRKQVGEYLAAHGWQVREVTQGEWEAAR